VLSGSTDVNPDAVYRATEYGLPASVECPFCRGRETELHSPFGSALSVATYWCNHCRTAFEWFKRGPGEHLPERPGPHEDG